MAHPQRPRKVCVVTANRADYTRLHPIMTAIKAHPDLELQTVVAGTHHLERFADTINMIEADGFPADMRLVHILEGSSLAAFCRSAGLQMLDLATWFDNNPPDIVVVMGDRFDIVGVALAGSLMNIHVAHVQGGEQTGSVDESLRHAITKLAHIHFPSTEGARDTIIRMGEDPAMVLNYGCPSVDTILETPPPSREATLEQVNRAFTKPPYVDPERRFLLVVQHPVTTEYNHQRADIEALLGALDDLGHQAVFLWPNVDAGSSAMVRAIVDRIGRGNDLPLIMVKNLEQHLFLGLMAHADCMVGNSSAGIREACYFGTPVVNIGNRQRDRERGKNVADVPNDRAAIRDAVRAQIKHGTYPIEHLYGDGNAGVRIAEALATLELPPIQKRLHYTKA